MRPSLSVRALNWLGDRSWVSDAAWWRVSDVEHALAYGWRNRAAPDGRVWLDARPALALAVSRRASRIVQRLHVRTDPTCARGRHVPRSRWVDLYSRCYACPACASDRRHREVLGELQAMTGQLYERAFRPLEGDALQEHAEAVVERYRREHGLGPSTAQQLRELIPSVYAFDPERAETLLRRAADELDGFHGERIEHEHDWQPVDHLVTTRQCPQCGEFAYRPAGELYPQPPA